MFPTMHPTMHPTITQTIQTIQTILLKFLCQKKEIEQRRAAIRKKWRKAIQTISMAHRAVAKFEAPIKQRRINLTKKLSNTLFMSSDVKNKKKKTEKQKREEFALRTVVDRFRLRRKDSYIDDLSVGEDGDTNAVKDIDAIKELEVGDPTAILPAGFGRGLHYNNDDDNSRPNSPASNSSRV